MSELKQLLQELREKKFDWEKLAVFGFGANEYVLGEVREVQGDGSTKLWDSGSGDILAGMRVRIKNPKRILRLSQMTPSGLSVQIMIGAFDMVAEGIIEVQAPLAYWVKHLGMEEQTDMAKLLLSFFKQRIKDSAAKLGIVTDLGSRRGG